MIHRAPLFQRGVLVNDYKMLLLGLSSLCAASFLLIKVAVFKTIMGNRRGPNTEPGGDDVTNVKRLRGTSPHFKQEKLLNTLHSSFFFLHICTHLALGGGGWGCHGNPREGEAELTVLPAKRRGGVTQLDVSSAQQTQ